MENRTGTIPDTPVRRSFGRVLLDTFSETVLNAAFLILGFFGWTLRWTVATVFFIAVMAAAGYYVFTEALAGGQHVVVPDIVGMDLALASSVLAREGLDLGRPTRVPDEQVPENYVIAQHPAPDRVVREGRKVYPTISMGGAFVDAPSFVNRSWQEVEKEVPAARFRIGHVARIPHTTQRDTVIAQDPPPGATIANQGTINLLLSAGEVTTYHLMPDLQGKTEAEARQLLNEIGVSMSVQQVTLEGVPVNVVLRQTPPADSEVYPGDTATVEIKYQAAPAQEEPAALDYEGIVHHVFDYDWHDRHVQVWIVDRRGRRGDQPAADFPPYVQQESRRAGLGPKVPITYTEQAYVEIVENNRVVARYRLSQGQNPVRM